MATRVKARDLTRKGPSKKEHDQALWNAGVAALKENPVKSIPKTKKQMSDLGALSDAISEFGEKKAKERADELNQRKVQPAFFIIRPNEVDSFFAGYKYTPGRNAGGKTIFERNFTPEWMSFRDEHTEAKLAIFSTDKEAQAVASRFDGAIVIPLNTFR